jgi:hypothetical protein
MNELIKNRGGQVTIFIIIAIIIVGISIAFFVFRGGLNTGNIPSEIEPINAEILSCLEDTTEEGITYVALQGGYYKIPEEIDFSYVSEEAPYYYMNSKKYIPTIEKIDRELENYISENLESCLNFSSFEEQGFEINKGDLSVSISADEGEINVNANYPLAITRAEESYRINEFKISTSSGLENLYSASEEIVNLYYESPGLVCLDCLEEISSEYNVKAKSTFISDVSLDENVIWFSVSDNDLNWRFVVEQ